MTTRQAIFWSIIILILAGLVLFFKFNPLFATFEAVIAFLVGLCGEWVIERIYNKWVK